MKRMIFLFCILLATLNADKLGLVKVNTRDREMLTLLAIPICYDFQDALLIRIDEKTDQLLHNHGLEYEVLDSCFSADYYFLIVKQKDKHYQGAYLWANNQFLLVKLSEGQAQALQEQGFILRKLREYLLMRTRGDDDVFVVRYDTLIAQMLNRVTLDSLVTTLYHLQNYGTRYTYSPKCDSVANWLYQRFQTYNIPVEYDIYLAGTQRDTSYNVIATITGQVRPESIVIICGHFDSYSNVPYISAPGADDNATGTAVVLEAARILSQYRFRWTIKFIGFSGEEQWMLGSYHYVDSVVVPQQLKIGGVFNFDMIAYTAYDSTRLYVNHNLASTSLAVLAESANTQYNIGLNLIKYWDEDCYGDNTPFWERGYKAVFALEDSEWGIWNGSNPHYHTTHDTVGNLTLNQVLRAAKLGIACVAMMAKPISLNMISERPLTDSKLRYFLPTIVRNNLFLPENKSFTLYDMMGKKVAQLYAGNNCLSHLSAGVYFIKLKSPQQIIKIIIQR
ncbi:MAG: M28 family peptidase [candidate division WOR-3 bacterium]